MEGRDERLSTDDIARTDAGARRSDPGADAGAGADAQERTRPAGEEPLFAEDDLETFHREWDRVQTAFVDDPRRAVADADALVADVLKRLADRFSSERSELKTQWDEGDTVDTETLRQTLRRYRAFFNRLLSA